MNASPEPILTEPADDARIEGLISDLNATADPLKKARESLESAISGLKLTNDEELALAAELRQLRDLTEKLDENRVEIAAFGMVSRGKSSVLNALLGQEVFVVGATHGTTVKKSAREWEIAGTPKGEDPEPPKLVLVDTPGIDEVGGEFREALALEIARRADLLLFVVSGDMTRRELDALSSLRKARKPMILAFNQIDRYPDADRAAILEKIQDERVRNLIRPEDVIMTAARPDPLKVRIQGSDGSTQVIWERPAPVIEPLKKRILEVLETEGKALIALNTLLFAGDVHQEIVEHKLRIRDDAANKLIWRFAIAKGAAVALNPIPVADMAGGLAVDIAMIVALSRVYGIPLTRATAASLVKDMLLALGALGAIAIASKLLTSGLKSVLGGIVVATGGFATPLSVLGFGAIGAAQAGAAGTTSYILGQGAKVYISQGCQWGPKGIKTVIHQILEEAKNDSVLERLREELKHKVQGKA